MTIRPRLYMLVGFPGCGKSTWTDELINLYGKDSYVILSTDRYVERIAEEQGKTYQDVFKEQTKISHKVMEQEMIEAIAARKDVIWDQTNLDANTRKRKIANFPADYLKIAVWFITPDETLQRVNQERYAYGRAIPRTVLEDMRKRFQEPTIEEGFDDVIIIERDL